MKLTVVTIGHRLPAGRTKPARITSNASARLESRSQGPQAEPREGKARASHRVQAEATRIEAALERGVRRVILDEQGTRLTSVQLAERSEAWLHDGVMWRSSSVGPMALTR